MNSQDLQNLQEAYLEVYQELDEDAVRNRGLIDGRNKLANDAIDKSGRQVPTHPKGLRMIPTRHSMARLPSGDYKTKTRNKYKKDAYYQNLRYGKGSASVSEQVDIYDIILSHLLDEGYADTPEQAEVIMVNMSEEWRESIVEEMLDEARGEGPEAADPGSQLSQQLFRGVKKNRGSKLTRQDTASVPGKGSKANRRMQNN